MSTGETGRIGPYELRGVLGRGGSATVYRALDPGLGREVAVKLLTPKEGQTPILRERFRREAQAVAQLHHPNIVAIYTSGEDRGVPYLVMELFPAGALSRRLGRPLALADAAALVRQIGAALDFAHTQGFIHRDVKPANIFLDGNRAVLADFGIVKAITGDGQTRLTETRLSVGTPEYTAPEQALGEGLDGRADLYALGAVLYVMLTGTTPFEGNVLEVLNGHVSGRVPDPRRRNPAIPLAVSTTVLKALARYPEGRYPNGAAFADALDAAIAQGEAPGASPAPDAPDRTARTLLIDVPRERLAGTQFGALPQLPTGGETIVGPIGGPPGTPQGRTPAVQLPPLPDLSPRSSPPMPASAPPVNTPPPDAALTGATMPGLPPVDPFTPPPTRAAHVADPPTAPVPQYTPPQYTPPQYTPPQYAPPPPPQYTPPPQYVPPTGAPPAPQAVWQPPSPPPARRRGALLGAVATALVFLLVAAGAGAWWFFLRDDGTDPTPPTTTTQGTATAAPSVAGGGTPPIVAGGNPPAGVPTAGVPTGAFASATVAAGNDPARAQIEAGDGALGAGRFTEAVASYREALRLNPNSAIANRQLGLTLWVWSHEAGEIDYLDRATKLAPNDALAWAYLSFSSIDTHQVERAYAAAGQAVRVNPQQAEGYLALVNAHIRYPPDTNDPDASYRAAQEALGRAKAIDPEGIWTLWFESQYLQTLGQYDESLVPLDKLLAVRPDWPTLYYAKGGVFRALGRRDEARALQERALGLDPEYPYAQTELGWLAYEGGDYPRALDLFGRALRLTDDTNDFAHTGYGWTLAAQGDYVNAIARCRRAVQIDARAPLGYECLGSAYLNGPKDYPEATGNYRKVIELRPQWESGYIGVALVHNAGRNYAEGEKILRQGTERIKRPRFINYWLGLMLYRQAKYADAQPEFERAAALVPDNAVIQFWLGSNLEQLALYPEARAAYERALTLDADYQEAKDALERLRRQGR